MDDKYNLESLIKTFERHAIKAEIIYKKERDDYRLKFNKELPEEDFSISKALFNICTEIQNIKSQLKKG